MADAADGPNRQKPTEASTNTEKAEEEESHPTEEQLEASLKESEEALQHVSKCIEKGWAGVARNPRQVYEETQYGTAPTPSSSSTSTASPSSLRSSRSSNVMEQLMSEMDQVFSDILVSSTCSTASSFAAGDYSSSSQDDRASSSSSSLSSYSRMESAATAPVVTVLAPGTAVPAGTLSGAVLSDYTLSSASSSSLASSSPPPPHPHPHTPLPPLAHLDEFSTAEEGGMMTEDDEHEPPPHHHPHEVTVVEVNGASWLASNIDLEKIFLENGEAPRGSDMDTQGDMDTGHYPLIEFAERYYNVHTVAGAGYSGAITKTVNIVRKKSNSEILPLEDLVRYTKHSHIPCSHVHLLSLDNNHISCSIFKDLCKYSKGEGGSRWIDTLHTILAHGIERTELRDEIFCQLMRQTTDNPHLENVVRVWGVMALCCGTFSPSHTLRPFLISHLRRVEGERTTPYAEYCLRQVERRPTRQQPPSMIEIEAVVHMQPLVYRIYLLDGQTKGISLDPTAMVADAMLIIQAKLELQDLHGWAIFESTSDSERYIHSTEYLADIVAKWEQRQQQDEAAAAAAVSISGTPKKASSQQQMPKLALHGTYGKLVFCKRIYNRLCELPDDPVEYNLLYAQAQHYVVHADEYLAPAAAAVHLAGLQAQVEYGIFDEDKMYRYDDVCNFLSQRVIQSSSRDWSMEAAAAHKRFGRDKSVPEAKLKYLSIVSQFPLFGCTKIFAHYRGIWAYGVETLLAVNYDGLKILSVHERTLVLDVYYAEIEQILLEESHEEFYIILQLKNVAARPGRQKCYMFECLEFADFASLIEAYSPHLASWMHSPPHGLKQKFKPSGDWIKLYEDLLTCRRLLVTHRILHPPPNEGAGLLQTAIQKSRSWICRLSGRTGCKMTAGDDDDELEVDVHSPYWAFTRSPFKTSMLIFESHEMEDVAARMFNSTLVYSGLESAAVLEDMDLIVVVQTLIIKCMENDDLCNEFYVQLIRQTTDTQTDSSQRSACLRYWHLMTMATCVMHPPNPVIFSYLNLHLKFAAMDQSSEEGKYALFCIKSLYRTCEKRVRKYPPSFKEIAFVTKRQPIDARVHLPDGHQMLIEFDSAATADEVMQLIKAKAGMRLDAEGFGIYQVIGPTDECILPEETLADALYKWERWAKGSSNTENPNPKDIKFIFRKRLFIEPYVNMNDPVEIEMLYTQSVTDVFEEKIPLTKQDAVQLCALRAQTEFGDYVSSFDYSGDMSFSSVVRILPRHLRDLMQTAEISGAYKKLNGLTPLASNVAFLNVLREWPLYGATMYEVTQSQVTSLPAKLWLAVTQIGLHLMEVRGQIIYATYPFHEVSSLESSSKSLTMSLSTGGSLYFLTGQAVAFVRLVEDYKCLLTPSRPLKDKGLGKKSRDSLPTRSNESLQPTTPAKHSAVTIEKEGQG